MNSATRSEALAVLAEVCNLSPDVGPALPAFPGC
jgi:hypothetical protein